MARVTLQTIADRVGVSRMTVSNAFSRPDQLSRELRDRILGAARDLGYAGPDPTARALARGSTGTIGILLTDSLHEAFTDEVATRFLAAIVDELAPSGLALTLLTANGHPDVIPARDAAMDGALVYSCRVESAARDWLIRRKLPLVFVDQDPVSGFASVNVDDRGGAQRAAQHVIDLGHRSIGLVTVALGEPALSATLSDLTAPTVGHPQKERMLGWLAALEGANIVPSVVQVPRVGGNRLDHVRALLESDTRPTAVLCFSDVLARDVVLIAAELGLRVPQDLSVVGFDDSPLAERETPTLTTVRQDVAAKGRLATAALTSAIAKARAGGKDRVRHQVLPTELVVRNSTAPSG